VTVDLHEGVEDRSSCSRAMPRPVSRTRMRAYRSSASLETAIVPPGSVNFTALARRFSVTCRTFSVSARTRSVSSQASCR
jgi:hypothetical protein